MTDAERALLLTVAKALAAEGLVDWRLIGPVADRPWRVLQAEADIARGRMIAAAMD